MDIARPDLARKRRQRRFAYSAVGLLALTAVTLGLTRLKPAPPGVDRAQVWTNIVQRGDIPREVRGNGSLVPKEIHWVAATTPGRVTRILILPGAEVTADMVLVELTNPEVEQAAFDAEWTLKAGEAQLNKLEVQLEAERLSQASQAAELKSECSVAKLDAEADAKLAQENLVDRLTAIRSRTRAEQLSARCELEDRRLEIMAESHQAQIVAQEAELERLRAVLSLKRKQLADLKVVAGIDGVLQRLGDREQLQVGQQIAMGANIARVADPRKLKAEVRVVETQAKDIALGQTASVDTRNGIIPGHVVRIDPAVQNGTVTVDVTLDGALPKGARPDLSVEGTILIERLTNVLYVGRPVHGQPDTTVGLFKLVPGSRDAMRVPVKLGRSSVNHIEILQGLDVGDIVILSDMSQWDAHDRVRLN